MSTSNELILIVNPNSQGGTTGKNWNLTYEKIKKFLPTPHRIVFTKKANDGTNLTRKLLKRGYDNIAAIGGDGTINEVANGFFNINPKNRSALDPMKFRPEPRLSPVNAKAALWIIPSGSRNVLASSLGIMHQGMDSFRRIRNMKKRKIDVIGVTIADKDNPASTRNRIVLNAAEMGVGAEIISRTLTIFATILLPLTLVATIYGMNGLDLNSLSKLPSGFMIVIVTMIIITVSLFLLFTKKKWIIFRGNKALPKDNPKT